MSRKTESLSGTGITLERIQEAANKIKGYAFHTPSYKCFSEQPLSLKLESFQPVRSFKIRGAANKILSIPEKDRAKGVITASSGNHGLAVAFMSNRIGINATVVLPENVVSDKLELIKGLGARAILFGSQQDERSGKADEIANRDGQTIVQPFNDEDIIAGQATCGLEIIEDDPDVETVFVPIGGGGLIAGVSSAIKLRERSKNVRVIGVQPEGSPSMYESWKKGELASIESSKSIADGLLVRRPGDITFSIVKKFVDDIILVSDDEIMKASFQLLRKEHILAEPSGAAAFAGALKYRTHDSTGKAIAVVSGGNISQEALARLISNYHS